MSTKRDGRGRTPRAIASALCGALVGCGTHGSGDPGSAAATMEDGAPGAGGSEGAGSSGRPSGAGSAGNGGASSGVADEASGSGGGISGATGAEEGGAEGGTADHAEAGAVGAAGCSVPAGSEIGLFTDPVMPAAIAPPDPPGIALKDTDGNAVDAHGGGIIKVCDTFYLHGEYFLSTTTDNDFNGFSMYSSKDLATWKNEGIVLPLQPSGQLGPNRKGERPHIIQCPGTGEFVLYAHSADTTYQVDKEIVYATSATVNGKYAFKGSLTDASGAIAAHSDMSALTDGKEAYVVTESGWVYTLAGDCHSWVSAKQYSAVNGTTGGIEAPTVFKAGNTYYWIGSDKTGWRANDDFYSTAPAVTGPWTYKGYLAPRGKLTWMTQSTWVEEVAGSKGTTFVYWGDHWYGNQDTVAPGKHNNLATYVFQPLVFSGATISLPTYEISWKLDVGAGTWSK